MSDEVIEENKDVVSLNIEEEMKHCYLDYAMSVIVGRALPDVRDGLKPVHRRVLFAMNVLNNYHNRPFLKSARVVGDVIGKYHPHGDSAVYNTIVRMAQDFSLRHPLVDGQGNFGSIDGDNAAAMRYTEVRMERLAEELLQDIDKETVDWQPNYDGSLKEPTVLPAKIPNILVNGTAGIAVGMATNIPPHNLNEIIEGLLAVIDNEDISVNELMEKIPGPDFPTKGAIHGIEGIRMAYHTGKGVIQIRAKAEIEPFGKSGDRERIVVTELPYQVNKAKLIEKIAALVNAKQLTGISDIRDESNRLGIRIIIDLKRGEIGSVLLNRLYKQTQLQISFGIILLAIHDGRPKLMNIKEMLEYFIEHRREVTVRKTAFELKKAEARAHILEGLKVAVENMDKVVELIKKSKGPSEAKASLMDIYKFSEIQAQAILDMRLQRLTGLEREKIVKDYENIIKEIARLKEILNTPSLVYKIIKEEFQEMSEKYGDERRTEIVARANEIHMEDLIKNEEVIVTITRKGYIKRMALDTYKSQKRGGTGLKGANLDEDFYVNIFTAHTHSTIMIFTNKGTVFNIKVYDIPEGKRIAKGRSIVNLIKLPANERVKAIVPIPDNLEDHYLLFATNNGTFKRSELSEYKNVKQTGIRGIKVVEGDSLLEVKVSDGKKDVLLCASNGKIIRFKETDCRTMGRVSQGVRGISLGEGEKVIGMELIDDNMELLTVSQNGYGKRTLASQYRVQTRGGQGVMAMKQTEKTGEVVDIEPVSDRDDLMIITDKGQVIRTKISGISLLSRNTQGVKLINLKSGEQVVGVEKIIDPEDDKILMDE